MNGHFSKLRPPCCLVQRWEFGTRAGCDSGERERLVALVEPKDDRNREPSVRDGSKGIAPAKSVTTTVSNSSSAGVPPGRFIMGTPPGDRVRNITNNNRRRCFLTHGFWMAKYEVTQGQWQQVMGTRPWEGRNS